MEKGNFDDTLSFRALRNTDYCSLALLGLKDHLRRQKLFVEHNFEKDADAAGTEAVDARLDEGLLQEALLVGGGDLEQVDEW